MASIKLTEDQVIQDHSDLMIEILDKFPTGDVEYSYEYCVLLDGSEPDMSSVENYVLSAYRKWGVSLCGKQGRKNKNVLVKQNGIVPTIVPTVIRQLFVDNYHALNKKKSDLATKTANLDSILRKVGRSGSSKPNPVKPYKPMNGLQLVQNMFSSMTTSQPVAPSLIDLKIAEPEIFAKYSQMADGTKLIFFKPLHPQADQWGFMIHDVYGAYTPLKKEDNRTRIIMDNNALYGCVLFEPRNHTDNLIDEWISLQNSIINKFDKAAEGEEFKGWKGAKEYRHTKSEIASMIKGRVFTPELQY